jgi:molybdopterin converting factor small subunit|uniref:MoaD/ThiS family protein n=1 Tax=Ignisphaera aggregans TaxID=334771 RepID=A0A7J2TZI8_9CREN
MKIKIKFFSLYKEAFGSNEMSLELYENEITVEKLINILASINTKFDKLIREFPPIILVNGLLLQKSDKIYEDSEVVIFPPASGGMLR